MKDYLFNKAYEFYPKQLNGLDKTYMLSKEIKNLKDNAEKMIKLEYPNWLETIGKLKIEFNQFQFLDKSNFTLNQPSLALQVILKKNDSHVNSFSFYVSLLIPYYYYTICKYDRKLNEFELEEVIINPNNELKINLIVCFLDKEINKKRLSKKKLNLIIPELSFETIQKGDFKVMNAFFNHKHILI